MFGHQIITEFETVARRHRAPDLMYSQNFKALVDGLKKARYFFMGPCEDLLQPFNQLDGDRYFWQEKGLNIRLPDKICCFEYISNSDRRFKLATLVQELSPQLILAVNIPFSPAENAWLPPFFKHYIGINSSLRELPEVIEIFKKILDQQPAESEKPDENIWAVELAQKEHIRLTYTERQQELDASARELALLNASLMLLSCKNITTDTVPAPLKLNKKRRKKGAQELFAYHTLKIEYPRELTALQKTDNELSQTMNHTPLDLAQGYFKSYFKKPLFGKFYGRYWWQPQLMD